MILDPASATHLKPWLVRTLEPICDAEPGALADYILALLKHNVPEPEMRKELAVQLDEFLEKECASFVDTLFTVLRTKSYLPYSASSPTSDFNSKTLDTGIPIPLDGLLSPNGTPSPERNRKRGNEEDNRDEQPPAKGPRLSSEGQFSRYGEGQGGRTETRSTGGWRRGDRNGYGDGMETYDGNRRPRGYQPPDQKRGICRDYYNNGYCARGAMCKYSHGEDAVVPGPFYPMPGPPLPGGLPFMPIFPGAMPFGMSGPSVAYDPHEARMDMRRPPQRAPLLPRIQQDDGTQVVQTTHTSGELPVIQDLTPNISSDSKPRTGPQSQSQPSHSSSQAAQQGYYEQNGFTDAPPMGINSQINYMTMDVSMDMESSPQTEVPRSYPGHRPPPRGGHRGGTFGGDAHAFRPERRNDRTLVVEKIPEDKLSLEQVNDWFKRFGTVTNVAIDATNAKALISFSTHQEAYAAWKSEDAVFGNRFVKLFWHRPMEGHGQAGARMLAASAPLVANISKESTRPVAPSESSASRKLSTTASSSASALAAKQQLLEKQIAEQKLLMASLETATPDEKKEILARLRKLGEEMKPTPLPAASPRKPDTTAQKLNDHQLREKERLDKELEMHNASGDGEGGESTEELRAKLERLKAEAARLGISDSQQEPTYGGLRRPYRGRGRGSRGYYRGTMRGGPIGRPSMKLDNRPKKLLIKDVLENSLQPLKEWYETTGQVESVEATGTGDAVVSFKTRAAAEQGLAKGTNIPSMGSLQISWYMPKAGGSASATSSFVDTTAAEMASGDSAMQHSNPTSPSSNLPEEEVVTSGWGEDADGEDGMGML